VIDAPDRSPKRERGTVSALARASGYDPKACPTWVWHLTPAGRHLFGDAGPDPAALAGDEVKRNLQRRVSRAVVGGVAVYVKRCRPNTPRAWAREVLRGPKARLEFNNALALAARGIATVEPLAWGRPAGSLPAESVLVTRELAGELLADRLARPLSPADRRTLAADLGRFLARLHAAGVTHPDPHPGNFLLTPAGDFALIDVHAVRLAGPLTLAEVLPNLVAVNRFFQMRATRADRLRCWRAYAATLPPRRLFAGDGDADKVAKIIEDLTAASNRRFWLARTKRHLGDNRDTRRVRGPAARGWAARDLPPDLLAAWLSDPDAPFRQPGAVLLKDSRTSTVARIDTPAGSVAYKRFNPKSPLLPVKAMFRRPPAVRSWLAGHGLIDRGLPTARPLACFQRHRLGLPAVGYLVCQWVPDAAELPAAVAGMTPRQRRAFAWELGRTLRQFHERDLRHRDLKAANVLVAGGRPVFVDLVGVSARDGPHGFNGQRDLARLARDFVGSPHVTNADRLRFLLAYAGPMHVPRYVRRIWVRRGWNGVARWVRPGRSQRL
jgi:tRNA A-37 threonylcarbamoyl transferase component Bud32